MLFGGFDHDIDPYGHSTVVRSELGHRVSMAEPAPGCQENGLYRVGAVTGPST